MRLLGLLALLAALVVPAAAQARPARFRVGTAVVDITPTKPQYLGGYDRMETPTADAHDPLQVRAFFVAHGKDAVGFAVADSQGWFAGYQEGPYGITDARQEAAERLTARGYDVTPADLIVSATHSHAAPTIMGIWGPTDPDYLRQVHDAAIRAIDQAAAHAREAELWTATGSLDPLIAAHVEGTDHFDGWRVDDRTPVLWAREPGTGATRGLYANVPVHADQFRGSKYRQASADYPGAARARLDGLLGGTAVVAMGTLGRQEAMGGTDDYSETARQGDFVTRAITRALGAARPISDTTVAGAEQVVTAPAHNAALLALLYANQAGFRCLDPACTIDRSIEPPYLAGNVIGTWVTTLRIGDVVWSSEPGEAFPEVSEAVRAAIGGARDVHVVGMAQDQLGYFYPPEDYPASELNPSDFILFNVGPTLADQTADAAALNAVALGLDGRPQHPLPAIDDAQAFFEPGVQFWPSAVESAARTRELLVEGKASQAPGGEHTVSPVKVSFGDGSPGATVAGEQRITHTFPRPGRYDVTARVTDERGQERTFTRTLLVDPPPRARIVATARTLRAELTGGDGRAVAAHWRFADGTRAEGLEVARRTGATVTVVDAAGDRATATARS